MELFEFLCGYWFANFVENSTIPSYPNQHLPTLDLDTNKGKAIRR
jgi:hypothetical protein